MPFEQEAKQGDTQAHPFGCLRYSVSTQLDATQPCRRLVCDWAETSIGDSAYIVKTHWRWCREEVLQGVITLQKRAGHPQRYKSWEKPLRYH